MEKRCVLLFSGGFDSTVLLNYLVKNGYEVDCLFFDYMQRNYKEELWSVAYWIEKFRTKFVSIHLPEFTWSKSTLYIENGNFDDYLEMRNLIFLSYAISYAESQGIPTVFLGIINVGDYLKDTSPRFIYAMDFLAYSLLDISVEAPFIHMQKEEVAEFCLENALPLKEILENTFSCNNAIGKKICGECMDCKKRKEIYEKYIVSN